MIPILDFAWHTFRPRPLPTRVDQLVGLCEAEQRRLFVGHDPVSRWCGVVVPNGVLALVEHLDLPGDAPVFDSGLLSAVGQGQLVARSDQPASSVARLSLSAGASCVVLVSGIGVPEGLFVPAVCAQRLPRSSVVKGSSAFVRYVVSHAGSDVAEAIAALEGEHTSFHAEIINMTPADAYVCREGGVDHYVPFCRHDPPHPVGPCVLEDWAP
jgi:hypothetical protein